MSSIGHRALHTRGGDPVGAAGPRSVDAPVPDRWPSASTVLEKPSLYLNPELSLLQFQRRVLEEACDPRNPLLERVKFLTILNSNLDEFFMVRVAGLMQQLESGVHERSIDGRLPASQLDAI